GPAAATGGGPAEVRTPHDRGGFPTAPDAASSVSMAARQSCPAAEPGFMILSFCQCIRLTERQDHGQDQLNRGGPPDDQLAAVADGLASALGSGTQPPAVKNPP